MSLSGLTGALGNPTFTAWTDFADYMRFATVDMGESKATLYLETTNWDTWTDEATNNSADQLTDIGLITSVYDGYARTLQIDSGNTSDADFSDGTYFGACFYIEDDSISCAYASYVASAYSSFSCYKNLNGSNHGDITG